MLPVRAGVHDMRCVIVGGKAFVTWRGRGHCVFKWRPGIGGEAGGGPVHEGLGLQAQGRGFGQL